MRIFHIEYPAFFLVNVRSVDDNAFQFVQVEGSWFLKLAWISHWIAKETRTRVNQVANARRCPNTDTHSTQKQLAEYPEEYGGYVCVHTVLVAGIASPPRF